TSQKCCLAEKVIPLIEYADWLRGLPDIPVETDGFIGDRLRFGVSPAAQQFADCRKYFRVRSLIGPPIGRSRQVTKSKLLRLLDRKSRIPTDRKAKNSTDVRHRGGNSTVQGCAKSLALRPRAHEKASS